MRDGSRGIRGNDLILLRTKLDHKFNFLKVQRSSDLMGRMGRRKRRAGK